MSEVVNIQNMTRRFAGRKVLDGMDLKLGLGRIVGLLAPNGEGKTTLFRLMMGLLTEDSGEIRICGLKPSHETNGLISYLPDQFVFDGFRRIKDAVSYMDTFFSDFQKSKAQALLKKLHFDEKQKLNSLSKGQKEQVQLVLILSRKAKLFLLDEPLASVDPATREFIMNTILDSFGEDNTVIISTHVVMDIERILDEVVMLKNGKVHLQGEADDLRQQYGKTINEIFKDEFRFVEGGAQDE